MNLEFTIMCIQMSAFSLLPRCEEPETRVMLTDTH